MTTRDPSADFERFRCDGDAEALGRVFDALAPELLLLAAHLGRGGSDAEDLVQTTFLHALRDAASYDARRPLRAWLAGILTHRALDERKRRRADTEVDADVPALGPDAATEAAGREAFERIAAAMDALEEPYRQVLVLRAVHGLSPTAIAHALGRAPGTVRMQLARARERLRERLPREVVLPAVLVHDGGRGLAGARAALLREAGAAVDGGRTVPEGARDALVVSKGLAGLAVLVGAAAVAVALTFLAPERGESTTSAGVATPRSVEDGEGDAVELEPAPRPSGGASRLPVARGEPLTDPSPPVGVDVEGLVVTRESVPVAGASVVVLDLDSAEILREVAVTDASGRFRASGLEPDAPLGARAERLQPASFSRKRGLEPVPGETSRSFVLLRLGADGHRLEGAVVGPDGRPVPGAVVVVAVDEDARKAAAGMLERREAPDRETLVVVADSAGRFRTDEVPVGAALVVARAPDAESGLVGWQIVDVLAGAENRCDLRLSPGASVEGRVLDARGLPARVEVGAEWKGTHELGSLEDELGPLVVGARARTRPDGSYRLAGLLRGPHEITVRAGARRLASEDFELAGAETVRWDVEVEAHAPLSLRVLGPDGAPLAGFAVAWRTGDDWRDRDLAREARMPVELDRDGRLRIEAMDLLPHRIEVFPPRDARGRACHFPCAVRTGVEPGRDELVLRLAPGEMPTASLSGTWLDARGVPVAGEVLALTHAGLQVATAATAADGSFRLERLPPLDGELVSRSERYPEGAALARVVLAAGEHRELGALALPDPAALVVTIEAEDGGPIAEPRVELHRGERTITMHPGADGAFRPRAAALSPGTYEVTVAGADLAPTRHAVEVGEQGETRAHLVCGRGVEVLFDVLALHRGEPEDPRRTGSVRIELEVLGERGRQVVREREWLPLPAGEPKVRLSARLVAGVYRVRVVDHTWVRADGTDRPAAELDLVVPPGGLASPVRIEVR